MTRVIIVLVTLCLATTPALSSSPKDTALPSYEYYSPTRGPRPIFFDDMESGENGWTTVDNTAAQAGTSYFHVDTYMAYQGDYTWWCGTFDYDSDGGYGNDWFEALCLPPTDVSGATYPVLTYAYRHDSETGYDFTFVQAESAGAYVNLQGGYDGVAPWTDIGTYGYIMVNYDNPLKIRFLFDSDPIWSDEDGLYLSNGGAFMVDNIKIFDYFGGYIYFYDDVESGGLCFPELVPASGDWWHIIDRACPAYSDSHSWWCGDDADTGLIPPNLNNSLISPWVDVSGVTVCTLKFAMHLAIPTVDNDYVAVSATNNGIDYVDIVAWWGDFETCDGWGQTALNGLDLAHPIHGLFPADSIRVRFTMYTTMNGCGPGVAGDAGVMIDDVLMETWDPAVTWNVPGDASTIQAALDAAYWGDTVLVAPGTYSPSTNGESFPLRPRSGVTLTSSGGAASTILDAEGTAGVISCIDCSAAAMISGFTITGGNAADGGGILLRDASPDIERCLIVGNTATSGGGIFICNSSEPHVYQCTLFENEAVDGSGITHRGGGDASVRNTIIVGGGPGAAVYCTATADLWCNHTDIYGNAGGDWVGCVASQLGSNGNISADPGFCDAESGDFHICSGSPCFLGIGDYMGAFPVGCLSRTWHVASDVPTIGAAMDSAHFYDTVEVEAGVYHEHDIAVTSGVRLQSETGEPDCVVIDAGELGRVLDFDGAAPQTEVEGFTLTGGYAIFGAGVRLAGSSPVISDCVVTGCSAGVSGGAVLCTGGSSPQFERCTFTDNDAAGAGIACTNVSAPSFTEVILAYGSGTAVSCDSTSSAAFTDSDVYAYTSGNWTGAIATQLGSDGNIEAIPGFCDRDALDLCLCSASPCVLGGGVHMGAFPVGCASVTWDVPSGVPSIAAAMDSASAYDTVVIDCGTYYEHDIALPPGVSVQSVTGSADCVTIDAGGLGRVMGLISVPGMSRIEGLTLTGGSATVGGGLWLMDSSPEITGCVVSGNVAIGSGGGVSCNGGSGPQFTSCTFYGNSGPDATVAAATSSGPVFTNTILAFGASGAAVSCDGTSGATLACSDVYGNAGGDWVGCIAAQAGVAGNFEEDPDFVDAPGGDFHLFWSSPCILGGGCGPVGALGPYVAAEPGLGEVSDVPDDEGGSVSMTWGRSEYDGALTPPVVLGYEIYRRQDTRLDGWDLVGSVPATQEWLYEVSVPTLCDSTPAGGVCWSTFFVRATTESASVYFDSQSDSGYSVDNLAPAPPQNLTATGDTSHIILTWDENNEPDFDRYAVYRDTIVSFDPIAPFTYVYTGYFEDNDPPASQHGVYYVVTAWDTNGNESDPSEPDGISTGIDDLVPRLRLTHAVPNPFNPRTVISYELPEPGTVNLRVFDASGKLVCVLVSGAWETGGVHHVSWNGSDDEGVSLPSGVYFYRLEVGGEVLTKRMMLLK